MLRSWYLSMASRISRRAARNSRSRSARTLERASGTAMLVRTSMMVNATINSTSVNPFLFPRLISPLFDTNRQLGGGGADGPRLRVSDRHVERADGGGAGGDRLEPEGY